MIRYNRKSAEEGGTNTRAPGRYHVKVIDAEEGTSKKGDPKINLRLANIAGKTIGFDTLTFGEKSKGISHAKLQALGYDMGTGDDVMVDATRLIGLQCWVTFAEETFNGKTNLRPQFSATTAFGYESMAGNDTRANEAFDKALPF